jgi:hypothetical protein
MMISNGTFFITFCSLGNTFFVTIYHFQLMELFVLCQTFDSFLLYKNVKQTGQLHGLLTREFGNSSCLLRDIQKGSHIRTGKVNLPETKLPPTSTHHRVSPSLDLFTSLTGTTHNNGSSALRESYWTVLSCWRGLLGRCWVNHLKLYTLAIIEQCLDVAIDFPGEERHIFATDSIDTSDG